MVADKMFQNSDFYLKVKCYTLSECFQLFSLTCQAYFICRKYLPNYHVWITTVCQCPFKGNGGPLVKCDFILFVTTESPIPRPGPQQTKHGFAFWGRVMRPRRAAENLPAHLCGLTCSSFSQCTKATTSRSP